MNDLEFIKKQYWANNDKWIFQVKIGGQWIELDDYEACLAYPTADYRLKPVIVSFEDIDIPDDAYCYGVNHPGAIYLSTVKCDKFATFHGWKYSVPYKAWISFDMWSADPFEVDGHYLISLDKCNDHILTLNGIEPIQINRDWFEAYEDVRWELAQKEARIARVEGAVRKVINDLASQVSMRLDGPPDEAPSQALAAVKAEALREYAERRELKASKCLATDLEGQHIRAATDARREADRIEHEAKENILKKHDNRGK